MQCILVDTYDHFVVSPTISLSTFKLHRGSIKGSVKVHPCMVIEVLHVAGHGHGKDTCVRQNSVGKSESIQGNPKAPYASVISRNRRTVLNKIEVSSDSCRTLRQETYLRTVAAAVVETVHAPPATTFLHDLHPQMPTA